MTLLTSLLTPSDFDPAVWSDATLGRMVHRAAQYIYQREETRAAEVLAEMPEDLPFDIATARLVCELWMFNQESQTGVALELFESKRGTIDPSVPLGALALYQAAVALVGSRRHEEALDLLAVAECTFRDNEERIALGLTYGIVGGVLSNLGDMRASVKYFAASYEELSAYGTDRQIIRASFNLVFAYAVIGRHEDAFRIAENLYTLLTDKSDAPELSLVYGRLEYCCELLGRYDEALKWNAKHIDLARLYQQDKLLVCLEIDHAFFALRLKRSDEARQILATIPDATAVEIGHYKVRWAFTHGLIAFEDGDEASAVKAFTDAIEYCTLDGVSDELRLRVIDEIVQLTRDKDGLPRNDFAAAYISLLKQRMGSLDQTSSSILDAHTRYATRLAQYQRERDEQLHTTLLEAGEEARRDIATSIHDGAGQELAVLGMQLDMALHELPTEHPSREHVVKARDRVSQTARQLRSLSHALGTHMLERDGLPSALYSMASDIRSTSRINVSCYVDEHLAAIPNDLARSIYRTVQTLTSNTLQHAFASNLDIAVTAGTDAIIVHVKDDGNGIDMTTCTEGLGWRSIRARVELRRGSFAVTSSPGGGMSTRAVFPYATN